MQFILSDPQSAATALCKHLQTALPSNKVLWLVSGGSNITASITIMQALPADLTANLTVLPVDERFGPPGHANSNWQQLLAAGFAAKKARLLPVLRAGQTFESARDYYEQLAQQAFREAIVCIGQLGLGSDGHIAGILPHSLAVNNTKHLVTAYESTPYKRLTLTFSALKKQSSTYVLAYGADKRRALESLHNQNLPLEQQPAQFLKQLPKVYLYNDQLGEDS